MLYGADVAICSEINKKQMQCGQSVKFLTFKPVGAHNQ